jgi:hypothetical protein
MEERRGEGEEEMSELDRCEERGRVLGREMRLGSTGGRPSAWFSEGEGEGGKGQRMSISGIEDFVGMGSGGGVEGGGGGRSRSTGPGS